MDTLESLKHPTHSEEYSCILINIAFYSSRATASKSASSQQNISACRLKHENPGFSIYLKVTLVFVIIVISLTRIVHVYAWLPPCLCCWLFSDYVSNSSEPRLLI